MKELVTTYNQKVTSADTDMFARIRPGALVNLLIQSAIKSADNLGFGFGDLKQHKLFWVLSRLTLEIYRPLNWNESVEIETWPKDIEKYLYLRDFIVRDTKNNTVARATSGWLAININTKRPSHVEGIHSEMFDRLKSKHALEYMPEKLSEAVQGDVHEIKTSYFDIDLNKHVTATRYIDWIMDTFPIDYHEKHYPKNLSINYMKETMPEESIQLIRQTVKHNAFGFEGLNTGANTVAFRGKIAFE